MTSPRAPRGFQLMTPERRKEIAAKGGAASPGHFAVDRDLAREAGKKGGQVSRKKTLTVETDKR